MSGEKRICIGETEQAGLPISAPLVADPDHVCTTIRWRRKGGSFVLEQWRMEEPRGLTPRGIWFEVPCLDEGPLK